MYFKVNWIILSLWLDCIKLLSCNVCERDLENLESLGLEGGRKEDVYHVKLLSLEYERYLYL